LAVITAVTSFVLIVLSIWLGLRLRDRLPEHHLSGDSKEVIRLATALIGTMAAVVVALLFASTRSSFEATNSSVARLTASVIELDQLLTEYGSPDGPLLRKLLRDDVKLTIWAIWPDAAPTSQSSNPVMHQEVVRSKLRQLTPGTPAQSALQARALQVAASIDEIRLTLFAQPPDSLAKPFITVLVLWLCFIFASFAMSSKANATLVTVLLICGFTASTAIYLILELGQPFDGLMQISNDGLRRALPPLS
jgi:hypothetical protein